MKMKKIFASVILMCLPVLAQSNIMVFSGITSTQIFTSNTLIATTFADWHNGVNFGISTNYNFAGIFYISPTFEYTTFSFDKLKSQMEPDIFNGNTVVSISGKSLKTYRTGVDFKFIQTEDHIFRLFMHTGVSYLIEAPVDITTISKNSNGIYSSNTITLKKTNYFVHDLGIGFIADIVKPVGVFVEGQYYSDFSNSLRFSLNGGIVYNFDN
jgi:hypothetical protein